MINKEKFEELGWKFKESESYNCIDFKSPRMKEFRAIYDYDIENCHDNELILIEFDVFLSQMRENVRNQFDEAAKHTCQQLTILARRNIAFEEKIKVTIEVYP